MRRRARFPIAVAIPVVLGALAAGCETKDDAPAFATREQLLDPATCKQCHADHYREWSGSMHAYASEDPVFRAMNKRGQRETNGTLGAFCVNCHAPMAVRDGKTKDGLNLDALDPKYKGVTCFFCHTIDRIDGSHNAALHLSDDLVLRGRYQDPVANGVHRAGYSPLLHRDQADSAKACGACHDIATNHGANIERTFVEWQASVFNRPGGLTCSGCHMNESVTLRPIAEAPNVFSRRYHGHTFAAIDTALTPFAETDAQSKAVDALLATTLQGAICVEPLGNTAGLVVVLDAAGAGHAFPSGSAQDRRLWVEVVASNGGEVVYESGVVPDGTAVTSATNDPDRWLFRDCIFDDKGNEVRMFWDAASYETNALPAQVTGVLSDPASYSSHVAQRFPRDAIHPISSAVDHVKVRVRLLPMGYDVIDDLVASGDLDPAIRSKLAVRDIYSVEWTPDAANLQKDTYTDKVTGIPARCVSNPTLFKVGLGTADAVPHTKCSP